MNTTAAVENGAQSHHSATALRILDVAEQLAQTRGFNGFSYADVVAPLGLTTAAMHYHFATKAELGAALMARYHERFSAALHQLDVDLEESGAKLHGYVDLYVGVLRADRMCLCGMLAAEFATLPAIVQGAVLQFLESNETWLASVLEQGRTHGDVVFNGDARAAAQMLFSGLEGVMLIARLHNDVDRFRSAADQLLAGFLATRAPDSTLRT